MRRARLALAVAFAVAAPAAARAQQFQVIGTDDLARRLAAREVVLVDARTQVEFSESHIPGAVLVPARLVAKRLPSIVKDRAHPVVFYCNGPNCTKTVTAAKAASAAGYTKVIEFKEGLPGWARAGRKTEGTPLPGFDARPISAGDLKALLGGAGAPVVVDVRDAEEFASFHIPGAVGVPVDDLPAWAKTGAAGRPIVLADHAGHQVPVAARVLAAAGRKDLRRLDGGILRWQAAGFPVVQGK